jgi:phospholipid transport system substrate-binding protein
MLTRRTLLLITVASAGAFVLGPTLRPAVAWGQATSGGTEQISQASEFVKRTGNQLIDIINEPGSMAEKQKLIAPIIDKAVDVDAIAQFCLGRYWRVATPEQQQAYKQLFHSVLVNSISGKLGEYTGVRFTMGKSVARDDGVVVSTTIQRPNNAPTAVDWVISMASGSPKIVDTIAEGTSLRLTQRDDYTSYLAHNNNNVQALIDALKRQISG